MGGQRLHENYEARIKTHQEALEYFTNVFEIQEIIRRIDEGTYNRVYEVVIKNKGVNYGTETKALRLSLKPRSVDEHIKEIGIHTKFANDGIALPIYDSGVVADVKYDRKGYGWAATVTEVAIGSLDYCLYRFPEYYNTISDDFIHRICTIVIKTARLGFMCGDIKPENILVLNDLTYMTDLDPTFCTKNEFLKRFCEIYNIPSKKCRMGAKSYGAIRKLKSRLMLFQLWKFIAVRYPKCQEFNVRFLKMCVDYINDVFPIKSNSIVVSGVVLRPLEVIENILGQDDQYYTKVVLNHYFGTMDMVKHKSFREILGSMYESPKYQLPSRKKNKRKDIQEHVQGHVPMKENETNVPPNEMKRKRKIKRNIVKKQINKPINMQKKVIPS